VLLASKPLHNIGEVTFTRASGVCWSNPAPSLTGLTVGKDRHFFEIISDLGDSSLPIPPINKLMGILVRKFYETKATLVRRKASWVCGARKDIFTAADSEGESSMILNHSIQVFDYGWRFLAFGRSALRWPVGHQGSC
jgi:hypothetical protein